MGKNKKRSTKVKQRSMKITEQQQKAFMDNLVRVSPDVQCHKCLSTYFKSAMKIKFAEGHTPPYLRVNELICMECSAPFDAEKCIVVTNSEESKVSEENAEESETKEE